MREMKDSGVEWIGKIPKEWKLSKTKYFYDCYDGKRVPIDAAQRKSGIYPYWGAGSITDYVDDYLFDEELVLVGEDGAPFFDYTRPVSFLINEKVWVNNHIHVLKVHEDTVPAFMVYYFNAVDYGSYINGSILNKLTQGNMNNIAFVVPSYAEQVRIVNYLDSKCANIDSIIEKQQAIIEKLKEYKLSVITEAVTKGLNPDVEMQDSGVDWIKKIPNTWTSVKLSKCISTDKGFAFKSEKFKGSGIPVVRVSEIKAGTVLTPEMYVEEFEPEYEKVVLNAGDILMTTVGSHPRVVNSAVGQLARVPSDLDGSLLNQNAVCLRAKDGIYKDYIYYFLLIKRYREHLNLIAHGTANQYSISLSEVLDFNVVVPTYKEQIEIANYLNKKCSIIEKTIIDRDAAISKLQEYKKSLIYEVVTGKKEV